jgi:hypothetical protein
MARIVGTDGDDVLDGTPRADVIRGLGGTDLIDGEGGADRIDAGGGDDFVFWDPGGGDVIRGGPGSDPVAFGASTLPEAARPYTIGADREGSVHFALPGPRGGDVTLTGVEELDIDLSTAGSRVVVGDLRGTGVVSVIMHNDGGHHHVDAHAAGVGIAVELLGATTAGSVLIGSDEADFLEGSSGSHHDVLVGNGGGDRLLTEFGKDVLDGDGGDDLFFLNSHLGRSDVGPSRDTIATGTGADRVSIDPFHLHNRTEFVDFDPGRDRVSIDGVPAKDYAELDTDGDGRLDPGDASVRDSHRGLTVDLSAVLPEGGSEVMSFDHLHSLPLDVFA